MGGWSRAMYYRREILCRVENTSFEEISRQFGVSEEDVLDIYYSQKITIPSFLERRVQETLKSSVSLKSLAKRLECSLSILRKVAYRLRRPSKRKRYVRPAPSETPVKAPVKAPPPRETPKADNQYLTQEIRSDRERGISVANTLKRLNISMSTYYRLVYRSSMPIQRIKEGEQDLVKEITKDREQGIRMNETLKRLNIKITRYQSLVQMYNIPLPNWRIIYSQELLDKIKEYRAAGMPSEEAAERLGLTHGRYRQIVKKERLPSIFKKDKTEEERLLDEIRKDRDRKIRVQDTISRLNISHDRYNKIVAKYSLPLYKQILKRDRKDIIEEIKKDRADQLPIKETLKRLKLTIGQYHGIVVREKLPLMPKIKIPDDNNLIEEIRRDREKHIGVKQTARRLGITCHHYDKIVREKGFPPFRSGRRSPSSQAEKPKAVPISENHIPPKKRRFHGVANFDEEESPEDEITELPTPEMIQQSVKEFEDIVKKYAVPPKVVQSAPSKKRVRSAPIKHRKKRDGDSESYDASLASDSESYDARSVSDREEMVKKKTFKKKTVKRAPVPKSVPVPVPRNVPNRIPERNIDDDSQTSVTEEETP